MHPALERIPNVWHAESLTRTHGGRIATGHAALDAALGGGWPMHSLIEILCERRGIGELQLLRALLQPRVVPGCCEQRDVVLWLNAPFQLQAVALAQVGLDPGRHWCACHLSERDALWAMEQALRSNSCIAVIAWADTVSPGALRRLKLAAVAHDSIGVLFRPLTVATVPSPASVRLRLRPADADLQIELLKVQGRRPGCVRLPVQQRIQRARMPP